MSQAPETGGAPLSTANSAASSGAAAICADCGSQIAAALLACPSCGKLVHADRLSHIAHVASGAAQRGELTTALSLWREALELLPPNSRQHALIREKTIDLSTKIDQMPAAARAALRDTSNQIRPDASGTAGTTSSAPEGSPPPTKSALGTIGALLIAAAMFILTKGKLLLAGLLKGGTFFSMLLSIGVYWAAFGWKFAVGLVVSIYIHEMGHVAMLRRFGIKASAPMFIPGVGAIVRLRQQLATPAEDARVGLAGPMWGLGAACGAYGVSLLAGWPSWAAIAHVGAWINLFNLAPIWQLDGGRAFNAMNRGQRGIACAALFVAWSCVQDGLLLLMAIVAIGRVMTPGAPAQPDRRALGEYVFLTAALTAMLLIPVPLDGLTPGNPH